jgi:hypothetical protein
VTLLLLLWCGDDPSPAPCRHHAPLLTPDRVHWLPAAVPTSPEASGAGCFLLLGLRYCPPVLMLLSSLTGVRRPSHLIVAYLRSHKREIS